MRVIILAAVASFVLPAQSMAATPDSIVALLGPSLGGLLAQSDLCGWKIADKIDATYQRSFKQIDMTDTQVTAVWAKAHSRQAEMAKIPSAGKARMKREMCTTESRQQVDHNLAN